MGDSPKFSEGQFVYSKRYGILKVVRIILQNTLNTLYKTMDEEGYTHFLMEDRIEPLRLTDTKITRKLYKGKVKRIEKGWIYLK